MASRLFAWRKKIMSAMNPRPTANDVQSLSVSDDRPVTIPDFLSARARGVKLTVLTAYDFTFARLFDRAGVDALLVGDSLGMVVQGHPHCLTVTLDEMIYHTKMVARAARRSLVIADMPFLTYQTGPCQALKNAGRLVQEGGAHAVKLEGGVRSARAIEAIVEADIPVMGHIGLTPQSVRKLGGFRVQRDENRLLEDARAVEQAGAFAVVIESVPAELARKVTQLVRIPTIGIGAGKDCDGQVLVSHDLLGLFDDLRPRFVKRYAELTPVVLQAVSNYCREVRNGTFPGPEHSFQ
jgi:3-methyl-2-oxobutanoate hydroxymethyltransferase